MDKLNAWLGVLRDRCATLPDPRIGANSRHTMTDAAMSAFAVFHTCSPSFLSFQRLMEQECGASNTRTLYGIDRLPTDNTIRNLLDGVPADWFDGVFMHILDSLDTAGALRPMTRLGGRMLVALDGTQFHSSRTVRCRCCTVTQHADGERYSHTALGAAVVSLGLSTAIPLPPEFIVPQDGHDKQDCETQAAKRWLVKHGSRLSAYRPVYLGDDLFSRQPMCEAVLAADADFIFTCKDTSHQTLAAYVHAAGVTMEETTVRDRQTRLTRRLRWMSDVPLRETRVGSRRRGLDVDDSLRVTYVEITETDRNGQVAYKGAYVTSLEVTKDNVDEVVACGRARWQIENGVFNLIKRDTHLEHNFGHGKKTLATVLAVLNLLAFTMHAADLSEVQWQAARKAKVTVKAFNDALSTHLSTLLFADWGQAMRIITTGRIPVSCLPDYQKQLTKMGWQQT